MTAPGQADGQRRQAEEDRVLSSVRPSARQVAWQSLEFYAFVHFGMNTMTGREWGLGHEDPRLFDPSGLDVDQWLRSLASAGMTGLILTAKHHDGFCLWPSAVTEHSVATSPWERGRGDLVGLVADAARRHGLRLGIYLSPWDRTEASYGTGTPYDDFFVAQLTELLSGYGPIFSVWFDGANGEGPDGRRQTYDWDRYYATIRQLQPDAVISVCGPDVRWCGNEAGHTRENEWSVVPASLQDAERITERSQHADDAAFSRLVRSDDEDLGSRAALAGKLHDLVWYPAEVNTSIRPGWFHHPQEDHAVRSADELFDLWCTSVGGNACLLLNVPPDRTGRVARQDVAVLEALGQRIASFRRRVVPAAVSVSSGALLDDAGRGRDEGAAVADPFADAGARWEPSEADGRPRLRLSLHRPTTVDAIIIREDIRSGQRVERLIVTGYDRGRPIQLATAGAIGNRRILRFVPTVVDAVALEVVASRGVPVVRAAGLVEAEEVEGDRGDRLG